MKAEITHSIAVLSEELDYSEGERQRLAEENDRRETEITNLREQLKEQDRQYRRLVTIKAEEFLKEHENEVVFQLCDKLMPLLGFTKPENFRSVVERVLNKD